MIHFLESEALKIAVDNTGAELQSIYAKRSGEEYLWQGDSAYWNGRAPVLFPIIGGLKNGAYQYNNKTYALSKHGFVRRNYFHRIQDESALVFEYVDNSSTRKIYPFQFSLKIEFSLTGSTLTIKNRVVNVSDGEMLFSIGAHEAYRCPRHTDETFNDYYLEFECDGPYESFPVTPQGLLMDESYTVLGQERVLPLKHDLFTNDALIFKNIKAKKVAIKSNKNPSVVEVAYDSAHLGIWTKVGAPFICIEPWCGLPDLADTDGVFAHKEGIIRLDAGAEFVFTHSITIKE